MPGERSGVPKKLGWIRNRGLQEQYWASREGGKCVRTLPFEKWFYEELYIWRSIVCEGVFGCWFFFMSDMLDEFWYLFAFHAGECMNMMIDSLYLECSMRTWYYLWGGSHSQTTNAREYNTSILVGDNVKRTGSTCVFIKFQNNSFNVIRFPISGDTRSRTISDWGLDFLASGINIGGCSYTCFIRFPRLHLFMDWAEFQICGYRSHCNYRRTFT